nr:MAG TPA: hypothetical protein [Caudoviricetes sp.]
MSGRTNEDYSSSIHPITQPSLSTTILIESPSALVIQGLLWCIIIYAEILYQYMC